MQPTSNHSSDMGATEIFRMPPQDATVPDLMGSQKPEHPTLTIVKGPQIGQTFELDEPIITLGRDPRNSVFLNDMTVSRHHARMDLRGGDAGFATVEDLGSLNGTWVDGAIVSKAALKDGSTIQIGTFRMVFHTNAKPRKISTQG
ncbi:MAG: FHA domain-containing protein [Tractidigestivibacter sp.]|uniref:FHA domain-containing protein n=1 Tax=Tractidigestivibacter sp. TaxID=2847320 RepID=UPI003D92CB51